MYDSSKKTKDLRGRKTRRWLWLVILRMASFKGRRRRKGDDEDERDRRGDGYLNPDSIAPQLLYVQTCEES